MVQYNLPMNFLTLHKAATVLNFNPNHVIIDIALSGKLTCSPNPAPERYLLTLAKEAQRAMINARATSSL